MCEIQCSPDHQTSWHSPKPQQSLTSGGWYPISVGRPVGRSAFQEESPASGPPTVPTSQMTMTCLNRRRELRPSLIHRPMSFPSRPEASLGRHRSKILGGYYGSFEISLISE